MNKVWYISIAVALFVLPFLTQLVDPSSYQGGRSRSHTLRSERNSSALARMLGEFRTSMGDILFLKTERYLHNGVAYSLHLNENELANASDNAGATDDSEAESIIPSEEKDFRGFVGDLHRAVKPYQDADVPHAHTDGAELLPWYRVMTLADPYNVRAYSVGAWWLKSKNPEEGMKFIEEGIEKNPDAFQLYLMKGKLLEYESLQLRGQGTETEHLKELEVEAKEVFRQAADLAAEQRPPGWTEEKENNFWYYYIEEDARAAMRFCVIYESRYGDKSEASKLANKYLSVLGSDGIIERYK